MVLGILLSNPSYAENIFDPTLEDPNVETTSNVITNFLIASLGGQRDLTDDQKDVYHKSLLVALKDAKNSESVSWSHSGAWGNTTPVVTYPQNSGYCRVLHVDIHYKNLRKVLSPKACYNSSTNSWVWYEGK